MVAIFFLYTDCLFGYIFYILAIFSLYFDGFDDADNWPLPACTWNFFFLFYRNFLRTLLHMTVDNERVVPIEEGQSKEPAQKKNGHGGAREGAGSKRKELTPEDIKE